MWEEELPKILRTCPPPSSNIEGLSWIKPPSPRRLLHSKFWTAWEYFQPRWTGCLLSLSGCQAKFQTPVRSPDDIWLWGNRSDNRYRTRCKNQRNPIWDRLAIHTRQGLSYGNTHGLPGLHCQLGERSRFGAWSRSFRASRHGKVIDCARDRTSLRQSASSYVIVYLFAEGAVQTGGLSPVHDSCSRSLRPLSFV